MPEVKYNEDELLPHSWMDEEFFTNVLVKYENDKSVKVTNLAISPGSGKGEHYASVLFRVVATYDNSQSKGNIKSMILKTGSELEGHKKDMFHGLPIFETESSMYSNTIPKLEAELRKIGDDTVLGPKIISHSLGEREYIIFEDLVPKGYGTLKTKIPNLTETKGALLKLAKWHAVSYKLVAEGDKSISSYRKGSINMKDITDLNYMRSGIDKFIELAENEDDLKKYVPKLRSAKEGLMEKCIKSANSYRDIENPLGIFSLCHGDFHANNLMFKENKNGELEDVMLLDFQMCYFGPAIMDIAHAKYMMFSDEIRANHCEELIYYYSSNFIETLKKLNFKGYIPSVADFYIDLFRHRHWDLFLISTFLPVSYLFLNREADFDVLLHSDEEQSKLYQNPVYIKEVKRLLPIMFHSGYLD